MVGTLTFQVEKLQDIWDEILPILKEHYLEIAHYKDIRFEPDVAYYFSAEDNGKVHTFTAREDGELIGYAVFGVLYNIHYKSSKQAHQDIIYIKKEKRGFGRYFIEWCDEQLRGMGVQVVYHHIKASHNWGKVLEKMGYQMVDVLYTKRLDKENKNE